MKGFYDDKIDKAKALTNEMKAEGWTIDDLKRYWWCLGYDELFIKQVVLET